MNKVYSWTRLAARTASAALGLDGTPFKLTYVLTKRCHSRCAYCDIWKLKDRPGAFDRELSIEEVRRVAAANPFFQWIDFTGGEPTDRPDFVDVVRAFAERSPHLLLVHFPTNGLATARILAAAGQIRAHVLARLVVTVSVDGPPEINDRLRGVPRDFAHAVATLAGLRRLLGPGNAYAGMTLHGHRASVGVDATTLVDRTFAALNEALAARGEPALDWADLHLNIPHVSEHYYGNSAARGASGFGGPGHRAEVAEALRHAASRPKRGGSPPLRALERVYRVEALRYLSSGRSRVPCSALRSTAYLSENGEVYPCTIWDRPLGNVRDHDFRLEPILEKARADGTRRAVAEGRCPNCWTPCEAYPAIAAAPLRSARALLLGK